MQRPAGYWKIEVVLPAKPATLRRRLDLRGQVQGVGFRPYVYRLATTHALAGFVANSSNGASIEVEGVAAALESFERELRSQLPPLARVSEWACADVPPRGETVFRIRASEADGQRRPEVTPDAATCADCRRELFDPADRRYQYPFINCTNCGPRYSIIRDVPYDRPQTTMAVFEMCPPCQREYDEPGDRRFHAQPNACADCGPQLQLVRCELPSRPPPERGRELPVREAAKLLRDGAIVAVKGIGGYHLACRADREDAVQRLRQRKLRDGKPLGIMVPNVEIARRLCRIAAADADALTSPAAPIVLMPRNAGHGLAPSVAAGCSDFGVMLPYAPLHHLLFAEGLGPLVMTSANLAGQPLTYRDEDALNEMTDVADALLMHDRAIFRPIDDSVVFTFRDETVPLRRARGYAPRPLPVAGFADGEPLAGVRGRRILAVGGELKSTVCLLTGGEAVLSEHLGDLGHADTFRHFTRAVDRLRALFAFTPDVVACDLHPRYLATEYAHRLGLPVVAVQHHHAHIASVMAEWGESGPIVGLACDGTGFGADHSVWGGELLLCDRGDFERLGHLDCFPLVGGDIAAIETWRPAAALVRAACGDGWPELLCRESSDRCPAPGREALDVFAAQVAGEINAPPTSSLGRVFDAVSFLLGLCPRNRHEAEAAMALEASAAGEAAAVEPFAYEVRTDGTEYRLSVLPAIRDILDARDRRVSQAHIAARFHETMARMLAEAARCAARPRRITRVALSGGCFANRRLLTRLTDLLEGDGFEVLYQRHVPCGDGGLALGQALIAAWRLMRA